MLIVVSIVGIMGYVASGHYGRVVESSRETVARNFVEVLNQGVSRYYQMEGDALRKVAGDDDSSTDEMDVLRALQWVDPVQPTPGGPYVRTDYDPKASANQEDHRLVWNGAFFDLRVPGEAGAGVKVAFDGADLGSQVTFPDDFTPLSGY